jgi:hypothetical protein
VLELFTEDAHLAINGKHVASGRASIEQYLRTGAAVRSVGASDETLRVSYHIMGAPAIDLDGDDASTQTYAVAHLVVGQPGNGGKVLVRGLRYLDDWRRTPVGWRICDRLHVADFGVEVPALYAATYEDRLTRDS